jgi:hypothetical protein
VRPVSPKGRLAPDKNKGSHDTPFVGICLTAFLQALPIGALPHARHNGSTAHQEKEEEQTSALAILFLFFRLLGLPLFFFVGSACLPGPMAGCGYMYGYGYPKLGNDVTAPPPCMPPYGGYG